MSEATIGSAPKYLVVGWTAKLLAVRLVSLGVGDRQGLGRVEGDGGLRGDGDPVVGPVHVAEEQGQAGRQSHQLQLPPTPSRTAGWALLVLSDL